MNKALLAASSLIALCSVSPRWIGEAEGGIAICFGEDTQIYVHNDGSFDYYLSYPDHDDVTRVFRKFGVSKNSIIQLIEGLE